MGYGSGKDAISQWREAEKWHNGEITKEEYDRWRYRYPLVEAERAQALEREAQS